CRRSLKSPSELHVAVAGSAGTTALLYAAEPGPLRAALVLAHGAGAGQRHPFLVAFARAVAALGVDVLTFNFLYTEQRRKLPDRGPALEATYVSVIAAVLERIASAKDALFIGGKSMGGRIATQVAAADTSLPIAGLVLLGYPLHPPGKPAQ